MLWTEQATHTLSRHTAIHEWIATPPRDNPEGSHFSKSGENELQKVFVVAIRSTGSFTIDGSVTTSWKNCRVVQGMDGYSHFSGATALA